MGVWRYLEFSKASTVPIYFKERLRTKKTNTMNRFEEMEIRDIVEIYTAGVSTNHYRDGSGISGYAVLLIYNGHRKQISQSFQQSTNNRMQMIACIDALKTLTRPCPIKMYLTSEYIVNSINQNWISGWKRRGWKNKDGDQIQNVDLWIQLIDLLAVQNDVQFIWIRGKDNNPNIEFCKEIANKY